MPPFNFGINMHSPRVLFILKQRNVPFYDVRCGHYNTSSGLLNSAKFVHDMLVDQGFSSKLVEVIDNNSIDREVTNYRPTHVIIEAFWVVPEKFKILRKLHPTVTWIIRAHSDISFLALEGMAYQWVFDYYNQSNVIVAFNSDHACKTFRELISIDHPHHRKSDIDNKLITLSNYYPIIQHKVESYDDGALNVGGFGAIRPLKNQLIQATAAVMYAKKHNISLRFHINGNRTEQKGDTVLTNIRSLFNELNSSHYRLVEHSWYPHEEFKKIVGMMDIGLQVSFTETFNIVTADFVTSGIPVVVSSEVGWVNELFHADCTDVFDIVEKMETALWWKHHLGCFDLNLRGLKRWSKTAKNEWISVLTVK